ncbi:unnamed protein product [Phytophthora fragariaefolia]|uniref:RxLR effector protein n=1 Tax=Phytophthora fragariaefolia TaxID=1490495 RepID=A0A9W6YE26_9STRA|nr:unnamed protein product [Phytophthora fragariaefolia]
MRLSFVFLVATATALLANGNAIAASNSTLASPDSIVSLDTNQHVDGEKRLLRKYDTLDEEEDSDDDDVEDRLLDPESLAKALADRIHRTAVFKRLASDVGPPGKAASMLSDDLYKKYRHWYYHIREQ